MAVFIGESLFRGNRNEIDILIPAPSRNQNKHLKMDPKKKEVVSEVFWDNFIFLYLLLLRTSRWPPPGEGHGHPAASNRLVFMNLNQPLRSTSA